MSKRVTKEPTLLTPEEAAERLKVTPRQVLKMGRTGLLRRVKLSHKTVRFEEPDVDELVRRRRQSGPAARAQRALFSADDEAMPARF